MKVLVVVPTLTSYIFLRELCLTMVSRGWSVHLATSCSDLGAYAEDSDQIQFHHIEFPRGMNPLSHAKAAKRLGNIVKELKPDLVDVHFSAAAFTAALARRAGWPPVIVTVQGLRFPLATGFQRQLLKTAECWSARKADKFIVLTQDDYNAMVATGCSNVALQEGYGFGCDLKKYDRNRITAAEQSDAAKEIGKTTEDTVFIYIGRLVSFKGFDLVIKAFWQSFTEKDPVKLVVCGTFDDLHPSGLSESQVKRFNADQAIVKLGWTDQVDRYLSVSDVVVFPSEREGVPVNLMESLSMGVPVITCDSRGCREVVDGGTLGILLKNRDVESLVIAMQEMVNNDGARNSFSSLALVFRDKFNRMHFVDSHIKILETELAYR